MNEEIMKAILELVQSGGQAAVWVAMAYFATGLLKIILIGAMVLTILHVAFKSIGRILSVKGCARATCDKRLDFDGWEHQLVVFRNEKTSK